MSPLLTQDAAALLLAPHLADLASSMRDAVERYNHERATLGPLRARTRACTINDYASENAERVLDGRTGVRLIRTRDESLYIVFQDRAIVRIKKLNGDLTINCIPTRQARSWAAQQPLEGFPDATNLIAGYMLDEFGDIDRVLLVCSKYGRRMWVHDLDDDASVGTLLDFVPRDKLGPGKAIVRSDAADSKDGDGNGAGQTDPGP